ncbi:MAG TPA: hypothetical protein VFV43_01715 [Limnobacter sp.]|nr:hypothetical protein [Limnobacter sp.]
MKAEGLPSPQIQQRTQTLFSNSIGQVQGAISARMGDEFQQQRLQGRALSGQFMGYDPNGMAKLKVGNVIVRLLLEVGTKPPPIGASLVVNITSRQPTLKYSALQAEKEAELDVFDAVLAKRLSQGELDPLSDLPERRLQQGFKHTAQSDVWSEVSRDGALLGKVSQTFNPREGVRLELMATQLGLLSRVGAGASDHAALGMDVQRLHPLMDALGMQTPDADSFQNKVSLLASLLRQAVEHSGLFYESHVKRWRAGQYALEALRDEPQFEWEPEAALRPNFEGLQAEQTKAALMANLQLNLLHNNKFAVVLPGLQGETVHLEIELEKRKDEEGREQRNADQPVFDHAHFRLRVVLPVLGRVHAHFQMAASSSLLLLTMEPHAAQGLSAEIGQLSTRLHGAQVQLKTFSDENP